MASNKNACVDSTRPAHQLGQTLGNTRTQALIYKQYICSVLEYASPAGLKTSQQLAKLPENCTEHCFTNHHWLHTSCPNNPSTLRNTGTHVTRSYQHAMDTISSLSQCKTCSSMPIHVGTPTNSRKHQDYQISTIH